MFINILTNCEMTIFAIDLEPTIGMAIRLRQ